jgi:putative acetyltransferase
MGVFRRFAFFEIVVAMTFEIRPALLADDVALAARLMREYQQYLGVDLCFQSFDEELAQLPGEYVAPRGGLYLVWVAGQAVGCGAFRAAPHDATWSEMKRVYLQGAARGLGAGRALVQTLVRDARAAGYQGMVLDTLPQLHASHALYASLGFTEIAGYTHNPMPGVRFYSLAF